MMVLLKTSVLEARSLLKRADHALPSLTELFSMAFRR